MVISSVGSLPVQSTFSQSNRGVSRVSAEDKVEGTTPDRDGDQDDAVRSTGAGRGGPVGGIGTSGNLLDVSA